MSNPEGAPEPGQVSETLVSLPLVDIEATLQRMVSAAFDKVMSGLHFAPRDPSALPDPAGEGTSGVAQQGEGLGTREQPTQPSLQQQPPVSPVLSLPEQSQSTPSRQKRARSSSGDSMELIPPAQRSRIGDSADEAEEGSTVFPEEGDLSEEESPSEPQSTRLFKREFFPAMASKVLRILKLAKEQDPTPSTSDIKKLAKSSEVTLAVIPGGLTSVLQPLDVCLNKPFKDRVRKMWHEWMSSGQAQLTKVGNLKKPNIELIAKWVRDAWEDIPEDMVQRAFKKCGISNAMDGSEDSALYENDSSDGDDCELSEDDNVYADTLTPTEAEALFGHTDDEEEELTVVAD